MTAPGWYYAEGDPPHTQRYWDGNQWTTAPVYEQPQAPPPSGYPPQPMPNGPQVYGEPGYGPFQRLGDPGSRIGARVIDFIITAVCVVGLAVVLGVFRDGAGVDRSFGDNSDFNFGFNSRTFDTQFESSLLVLFGFVWPVVWLAVKGGTPGKLMVGLRIADEATAQMPVTLQQAVFRSSIYLLPLFGLLSDDFGGYAQGAAFLIGLVSLIMLFSDHKHRTVMDRIAKTIVVTK